MKRIFHRYEKWEDFKHGMYSDGVHENGISAAKSVLINLEVLDHAMWYVLNHWTNSAQLNLSNKSRNRQAWLGQAACCWLVHANENETKLAWHTLTEEQQRDANDVADKYIMEFEQCQKYI